MSNYYEIYMNDELIASSENNEGILNPIVNKEINTAGSCSFTVLPSHPKWGKFRRYASFIDVFIYDVCVFRGRITTISMDSFKQKSIECEGALAFLMDSNIGAMTGTNKSQNIRDKISTVLQTHNGCINAEYTWPPTESTIAWTYPWDFRRTFIPGIMEPEGSVNIVDHPSGRYDNGWFQGYFDENSRLPVQSATGDRLIYYLNSVESTKTYLMCIDSLQYMTKNPSDAIVFYFYSYGDYVNKYTRYLSDIDAQQVKRISFTLSSAGVSSATEAYISVPKKFMDDGVNFWLQEYDSGYFNYELPEHYSETTEHGVTGDTFSTLFINNREAMIRTRPLDMTKRFLNEAGYTLSDEESYTGNVVDVLNPHRLHQGKKITFGVNLMELQVESPDFEPIVAVRPLKAGVSLWTTNSAGNTVPLVVENPFYNRGFGPHPTWSEIKDTGYPRNVKLLEVGENATNESAIARANYYFSAINCEIPKSFKVKALDVAIYNEFNRVNDLSYAVNMIDVGDPITIVAEPYDLNDSNEKDAQGNYKNVKICLALKLDILNPQNNEYTIGDYIPDGDDFEAETLTKKFANEKKKKKK